LEWKQRFRLAHAFNNPHDSPFRVDRSPSVINRNRYTNVQPWDESRIRLKTPIGGSDYVNASPISLRSRSSTPSTKTDSSTSTNLNLTDSKYIATQGPKDGQFSHFWHMVMQETVGPVGVIVMLTQCYEGNKEKCSQYFPQEMENPTILLPSTEDGEDTAVSGTETAKIDDGDSFMDSKPLSADTDSDSEPGTGGSIESPDQPTKTESPSQSQATEQHQEATDSVTLISVDHDAATACEVRRMQLSIASETKEIYHYLFNGWPDYGKPEAEDRKALVELLRVSRERAGGSGSGNPRFVHCSAGVGRTGTFIALDFLLSECEAGRIAVQVQPSPPASVSAVTSQDQSLTNGDGATNTVETWGRSGPTKEKQATPDPEAREKGDLVFETVNKLREQRMMMVMNELQFSFIYEVVRDALMEMYMGIESGVDITGAPGSGVQEPAPKAPRIERGSVDEDPVSEAETEILDDKEVKGGEDADAEKDPYAVVAPESIQ
jgi:protein-tyrosine phosphatase